MNGPAGPPARGVRAPIEIYIAAFATAGIAASLVMQYGLKLPVSISVLPLYAVLVLGGLPLLYTLARKLIALDFGSDLLAGISIATSVLLGEYIVGCIVVLMLSGGEALEQFAARRASSILAALSRRMPNVAHRATAAGIVDVALDDIVVGDALTVLPHELCPVDGTVTHGHGWMDESYLTGEPYRTSKAPGSQVLSGAINGDAAMTIEAARLPVDSRYARIMRVMREAEEKRPRLRRLADRLGAWYTPLALGVAGVGWLLTGSAQRFLAVVVIATPCPLLLAIPVAIIGAISLAARHAIIVKDPAMLERIDSCRAMVFDKTGTLTYGQPALTDVECMPGFTRDQVLALSASLERYSKHPLAGAVVRASEAAGVPLDQVAQISEQPGAGLRGLVDGRTVEILGRQSASRDGRRSEALPAQAGGLESLVFVDGALAAALRFRDEPRVEGGPFIRHLIPRHHIDRVMILSGDRESEVRYLAERVGIAELHHSKTPEEKVAIVAALTREEPTLFIGDGINDAPAMQAATVGLAFGQNSDITAEAADAVIMEPSLGKIDEIIHIGRRMRAIALQSAVGGMALSCIGMGLAVAGYLPPIAGAVTQEVIDVAAVLNALRVGFPIGELTDF
ncbi:MAG TPA: heavy metal translocating P-type ATPase [Magnetospirillaceae bacterium]|nr:heavy metal translocating P-type ATPase [Magnetospirillaceae bacterium]